MSSSSEDEEPIVMPVKRVKRRHHPIANVDPNKQKINLYSHKILPKLDALAKSPVRLSKDDEDEGNDFVPFSISPVRSSPDKSKAASSSPTSGSPVRSVSDASPMKDVPPTPPPPFVPQKKRGSRKAKKLLKEVSTVLSQVSKNDTSQDSITILDDSIEIVKEIMVKIRLHGKLQKYPMVESQTFHKVFDTLATKAKVDASRLLVTFGDHRVFPSNTPADINLTIADILECVIANRRLAPDVKDTIKIQMQGPFQKRKVSFTMGQTEPFLSVMEEYAIKNKANVQELQFRFDGDLLEKTATPKSLDMENGDCIDVMHMKKG
ncbi:NFATC2-interacting protein-like [Styela clava]